VVNLSFSAYGERRDADWDGPISSAHLALAAGVTRHGYTDHRELDSVNLIHMGGRVYDPVIGRFQSRDPFIDGLDNSQGPNGYAYVWNNPVSRGDPSGFGDLTCTPDPNAAVTTCGKRLTPPPPTSGAVLIYRGGNGNGGNGGGGGGRAQNDGTKQGAQDQPQENQEKEPEYCSSVTYTIANTLDTAGQVVQATGVVTATGGVITIGARWYTGAGDLVGGGLIAIGGSTYNAGTALAELGNLTAFLAGQSGEVTMARAISIPLIGIKNPISRIIIDKFLSHFVDESKFGDPCE
jgi:RHS repeat-associated protein